MPINDPIRNRKVAPRSLAFERESTNTSTTYQAAGGAGISLTVNITNTTQADVRSTEAGLMREAWKSERRAKAWVGAYNKQWNWTVFNDATLYIGGVSTLGADQESIRIMGAQHRDTAGFNGEDMWSWQCVPGQEGVYEVGAFYKIAFTEAMAISRVKLGVHINGTLVKYIDDLWISDAGELPILNAKVRGATLVQMDANDILTFVLFTTSGAGSGLQTFTFPTSIEGEVWGHRVQCDDDFYIDAPDQMDSYTVAT